MLFSVGIHRDWCRHLRLIHVRLLEGKAINRVLIRVETYVVLLAELQPLFCIF